MARGLPTGGEEAGRFLMFVDTQSLKHDKMRSKLRKNIITPLKKRRKKNSRGKQSAQSSFRGSQHLPPFICSFSINNTEQKGGNL